LSPIFLIILFIIGYFSKSIKGVPKDYYQKINTFIIFLPLPCITLYTIPKLEMSAEMIFPVASAWMIFVLAIPFFYMLKRIFNWSNNTYAALVLVCGLGNTAFIGFPIIEMLYGSESLQYAILVDQSTFILVSTVAVIWASAFGQGKISAKAILLKLLRFPPFLAFIFALIISEKTLLPIDEALQFLGSLMVPMAIFSIGVQFKFLMNDINYKAFGLGLLYKLLIFPALLYLVLFVWLKKEGILYNITLMECAMPPMITASIIANQYKLEGQLSNALVTYGIPISFGSLAIWQLILNAN
jgi:predicted permease